MCLHLPEFVVFAHNKSDTGIINTAKQYYNHDSNLRITDTLRQAILPLVPIIIGLPENVCREIPGKYTISSYTVYCILFYTKLMVFHTMSCM